MEQKLKQRGKKKYYWEEHRDLLKKHGISGSDEEVNSQLFSAASFTSDLLYALSSLSEEDKKLLPSILQKPRKTVNSKPLKKVLDLMKVNPKLLSAYVALNFTSPLVRETFGDVSTPEKLVASFVSSPHVERADSLVEAMMNTETYYDVGYMLKNSDPLTRTVFVKTLFPAILQSATSPENLSSLINTLRFVATAKKSHYEFFKVLERFRTLLFLFGPISPSHFSTFLRCLS